MKKKKGLQSKSAVGVMSGNELIEFSRYLTGESTNVLRRKIKAWEERKREDKGLTDEDFTVIDNLDAASNNLALEGEVGADPEGIERAKRMHAKALRAIKRHVRKLRRAAQQKTKE